MNRNQIQEWNQESLGLISWLRKPMNKARSYWLNYWFNKKFSRFHFIYMIKSIKAKCSQMYEFVAWSLNVTRNFRSWPANSCSCSINQEWGLVLLGYPLIFKENKTSNWNSENHTKNLKNQTQGTETGSLIPGTFLVKALRFRFLSYPTPGCHTVEH